MLRPTPLNVIRQITWPFTAEVVNGVQLGWQSIACWLGNTYRMGLIQDFGSCLPRKQKPSGLLVVQAVGWRLGTFSVAHRKPRTPVFSVGVIHLMKFSESLSSRTLIKSSLLSTSTGWPRPFTLKSGISLVVIKIIIVANQTAITTFFRVFCIHLPHMHSTDEWSRGRAILNKKLYGVLSH